MVHWLNSLKHSVVRRSAISFQQLNQHPVKIASLTHDRASIRILSDVHKWREQKV